jgi:hypothetical protein
VRTTTPNYLVYGELGRFPLIIDIKCRMLAFWNKLISSNKLSSKIARLLYIMNINGTQGFKWIEFVKSTFEEIGLSFMYSDQQYISADWLKMYPKQILRDQFIHKMEFCSGKYVKGIIISVILFIHNVQDYFY